MAVTPFCWQISSAVSVSVPVGVQKKGIPSVAQVFVVFSFTNLFYNGKIRPLPASSALKLDGGMFDAKLGDTLL